MTFMSLCLACGAANPLDTKFCSQCRSKLQIQERYRALKVIGQGGFGKTFLAQDESKPSKPRCVIKQFLYDDPETLREAQRLFEQEAVRLDDLGKHNQIPELLAHCEQEGWQYLVQEFIDGENLLQELQRSGRFSEAKIKELLLDLLPVLQFIHAGKVIHRDIKPENIIRRRSDGKLVLVDFGAAKMASKTALAKTGTTIGSPEYTAPEQARGKAVFASDIYGLGVTCIYLLTQISPFDLFSDSEFQWVWRRFLNGITVNDNLGRVLDKMLEQALVRRYQTIEDVLQDLDLPKKSSIFTPVSSSQTPISISTNFLVLDCGNGVKLDLVKVTAGSFNMGSNEYGTEKPIHRVNLREFLIGKYAVTQAQYQAVMGNNPSNFKGAQNPVESVNWHDAIAFCKKLSQRTGQKVRLPSEAEWEYAAKGGNQGKGYEYSGSNYLGDVGWFTDNSGGKTHPVGQKKANELGIYDMSGNVWEWCEDVWYGNYNGAPTDGTAWLVGGGRNRRIWRGGSWLNFAYRCRSANRLEGDTDDRNSYLGFRVVI